MISFDDEVFTHKDLSNHKEYLSINIIFINLQKQCCYNETSECEQIRFVVLYLYSFILTKINIYVEHHFQKTETKHKSTKLNRHHDSSIKVNEWWMQLPRWHYMLLHLPAISTKQWTISIINVSSQWLLRFDGIIFALWLDEELRKKSKQTSKPNTVQLSSHTYKSRQIRIVICVKLMTVTYQLKRSLLWHDMNI